MFTNVYKKLDLDRESNFSGDTAPPSGCSQYLTGTSGSFYSLNYGGSQHLAGLDYKYFVLFDINIKIILTIIFRITIIDFNYSVLIIVVIVARTADFN